MQNQLGTGSIWKKITIIYLFIWARTQPKTCTDDYFENGIDKFGIWKDIVLHVYVRKHKQKYNILRVICLYSFLYVLDYHITEGYSWPDAIFNQWPEDGRCSLMTYQGQIKIIKTQIFISQGYIVYIKRVTLPHVHWSISC